MICEAECEFNAKNLKIGTVLFLKFNFLRELKTVHFWTASSKTEQQ